MVETYKKTFLVNFFFIYILICSHGKTSFEEPLEKDNSIHHGNFRVLPLGKYESYTSTSKEFMSDIFPLRQESRYSLKNLFDFYIPLVKSAFFGFESIKH